MKKKFNLLLISILFFNLSYTETNISVVEKLKEDDWVCSFFNDVLNSQKRDTYYKYSPQYSENPYIEEELSGEMHLWHQGEWIPENIEFSKNLKSLVICYHYFDVDKIDGNTVTVHVAKINEDSNSYADNYTKLNWTKLSTNKKFSLIFEFDGDYVDIYVNNKKNYFATFCRYDISTYNQLKDLIKTNECEPWMIEFPKRSDGSIDFVTDK